MSFKWFGLVAVMAAVAPAGIANAQSDEPAKYMVCWSNHYTSRPFGKASYALRLLNRTQRTNLSEWDAATQWREFVEKEVPSLVLGSANCSEYLAADAAASRHSRLKDGADRPVEFRFTEHSNPEPASDEATKPTEVASDSSAEVADSTDEQVDAQQSARDKRAAEWQAKLDQYETERAAYEAELAAQKAEKERQAAAHAVAQEEARKVQAAHDAKMAAHRRELDAANRRQQEYFAAQRRHALCVGGDQKACSDIAAGKPAMDEQLAANEEPATSDDDARTCVSRPVVSASGTFEGQTAAVVFNGCMKPVDVRICLLRTGGWNCGVQWGLQPQDRWTHTSFQTQGELFWDARMSGSSKPLASPEGD